MPQVPSIVKIPIVGREKNDETGQVFLRVIEKRQGSVDPMIVPEINFGSTSNKEFNERKELR